MGIYPQPNAWECGPFALKYALILLGIPSSERDIARIAGTDESGTDEHELARAARQFGCDLGLIRRGEADSAREDLREVLERQIPALLCVHGWEHWVTVAAVEDDDFVILDSRDPSVLTVAPWTRLRDMWVYRERASSGGVRQLYDLHPVMPTGPTRMRARLSVTRARRLREPESRSLAMAWDRYLEDLLSVSDPPTSQCALTVSLGELLTECEADVLQEADRLVGTLDPAARRRILGNVRFVAETYDLQVLVGDEARAIEAVGAILGRRASAALV